MGNKKRGGLKCCNEKFATRAKLLEHLEVEHDEKCPTRIALTRPPPNTRRQQQRSVLVQEQINVGLQGGSSAQDQINGDIKGEISAQDHNYIALQGSSFSQDQSSSSSPQPTFAGLQVSFTPTQGYAAHLGERQNTQLRDRIEQLAVDMKPTNPSPLSNMWRAPSDIGTAFRGDDQEELTDEEMLQQPKDGQPVKMPASFGTSHQMASNGTDRPRTNVPQPFLTLSAATMEPIDRNRKSPGKNKSPPKKPIPPKTNNLLAGVRVVPPGVTLGVSSIVLTKKVHVPVGTLDSLAVTPVAYEPLKFMNAPVAYHQTDPNYHQTEEYFRLARADPSSTSAPLLGDVPPVPIPANRTPTYMNVQAEAMSDALMEAHKALRHRDPCLPRLASIAAIGPRPKIAPYPPPPPGIQYGTKVRCVYESFPEKRHHLKHTPQEVLLTLLDHIGMNVPFAGNLILDSLWKNYADVRPQPTEEEDAEDENYPRPAAIAGIKRKLVGGSTADHTPDPDLIIARFLWCFKCDFLYDVAKNHDDCCIYHPGKKIPNASRSTVWQAFYKDEDPEGMINSVKDNQYFLRYFDWTCCGRNGEDMGCKIGRHSPAERENMKLREKAQAGHA